MQKTLVQATRPPPPIIRDRNKVRQFRENQLMSKAELARRAKISAITLSRVEGGYPCRLDTKRKILLALGLKLSDRAKVFLDLGLDHDF